MSGLVLLAKRLRLFALGALVVLLSACAHPDLVSIGDNYDQVMKELGAPDAQQVMPDGTVRVVYSMQPMGQQSYEMIFDSKGKMIFKQNMLYEAFYMKNIKPKIMNEKDVYELLGKPCETWSYALSKEHTYMYRYQEGGFDWAVWVDFDDKTNEVLRWVISIDPWSQRDTDDKL